MGKINWIQVLVFGLVVLIAFLVGLGFMPMLFGGGYWGMGSGMMGGGTIGGWCPWCGGTGRFGGGGMGGGIFGLSLTLLGLLLPIGLLGLLILGGVWLVRSMGRATASPASARTCPECGRPAEVGWQHCAYCGEELE